MKWIDRKFDFGFTAGLYSELTERFRGTPARIEDRIIFRPSMMISISRAFRS
jgi:hypothetical protein